MKRQRAGSSNIWLVSEHESQCSPPTHRCCHVMSGGHMAQSKEGRAGMACPVFWSITPMAAIPRVTREVQESSFQPVQGIWKHKDHASHPCLLGGNRRMRVTSEHHHQEPAGQSWRGSLLGLNHLKTNMNGMRGAPDRNDPPP